MVLISQITSGLYSWNRRVDVQAATLGVPLGNSIGPSELDIESVEVTPGAASALYTGMNAINGLANLLTKALLNTRD